MRKAVFFLLLFALFGCKTPAPVVSFDNKIDRVEQSDQMKHILDSLKFTLQREIKSVNEKISDLQFNVNQEKTEYSQPDSIGIQYPTSITKTNVVGSNKTQEKSEIDDKILIQLDEIRNSIDRIIATVNHLESNKQETMPTLTKWQRFKMDMGGWAIGVLSVVVMYIIIWLRKRSKK